MARAARFAEFQVYRDSAGEFRWRFRTANGRTIADGAEGYKRRSGAHRGLIRFCELASITPRIVRFTA